jgi:hypothetical protein
MGDEQPFPNLVMEEWPTIGKAFRAEARRDAKCSHPTLSDPMKAVKLGFFTKFSRDV